MTCLDRNVNDNDGDFVIECTDDDDDGDNVLGTILKHNVGGFESTVLQRNLKEWHKRPWTYVCKY